MKTSRQRILELFERKSVISAQEIASAMHMTAANARHHLRTLVRNGLLVNAGQRLPTRRGRPEQVYMLTQQARAHNLNILSIALLAKSLRNLDHGERLEFMRQIALEIADGNEISKSTNLGLRLQNAVRKLNAMNYEARWEARPRNPRLILGHCPYAAILPLFPELCFLDGFLTGLLSGTEMELIAKLEEVSPGVRQCVFQVRS